MVWWWVTELAGYEAGQVEQGLWVEENGLDRQRSEKLGCEHYRTYVDAKPTTDRWAKWAQLVPSPKRTDERVISSTM